MKRLVAMLLVLSCLATPAHGLDEHPVEDKDTEAEVVKEPVEPKAWYRNIIPIPVLITEPAIGQGLGIGVGYFHPDRAPDAYKPKDIETAGTEGRQDVAQMLALLYSRAGRLTLRGAQSATHRDRGIRCGYE